MANPFKDKTLSNIFDVCLRLAGDNFSEFYYSKPLERGTIGAGPRWPRRGATHRHHFWNGWNGKPASHVNGSAVHAAYRAGREFRRLNLKG